MLIKEGNRVDIACNIEQSLNPEIEKIVENIHILDFKRSPLRFENLMVYNQIKKIILEFGYDIVHVHTPVAAAIVRMACMNLNVKVFYTAHGFHFYDGAPIKNWVVFYPVEKFLSRFTDLLITINQEDYNRAIKSFNTEHIKYIPGVGLKIDDISRVEVNRREKRKEIQVPENAFLITSVGELNENKNHEVIIKALAKLNNLNIYYIICGEGPLKDYLNRLIKKLKLDKNVNLIGYRTDVIEILKVSDLFAFPSKREGLGMSALEAMAVGLPIITSNIHGMKDYSKNGVTGFTYNPNDVLGFAKGINKLYEDKNLCKKMSKNNIREVEKYDINNVIEKLIELYKNF